MLSSLKRSEVLVIGLKNKNMRKKTKLLWQIFPLFLIIIISSLLFVTFYSTNCFKKFFLENTTKELTIRTKLLEKKFVNFLKLKSNINKICKEFGEITETRITVILPSGVVIADSFGNINSMENHITRPEIIQAFQKKTGVSVRYSSTLNTNMIYIALPIINNNQIVAVVRTSVSLYSIDNQINSVRNNIFLALFFVILLTASVGLFMIKKITLPIEQMKKGAAEFAKGNLNTKLVIPDSEELSALAVTMNIMAENLSEKIKAFKNRSMELEAVHESMQEGVIAIDMDEKIITINNTATKIFGFASSSLKGKYILEAVRNLEFYKFIKKALTSDKPIEDDIVIKKDNNLILNIHSTALYDIDKIHIGILIIFHDITRIRKLEIMHKEFASNVSHELKTPLTTINGFIETLLEMKPENNIPEYEKFLKIIEKNVHRIIALINDLLSLSKLERLKGSDISFDNRCKVVLINLLQEAVDICHAGINKKNITVTIDCPEKIMVMVEPVLIKQAITNLIDNAVKYCDNNNIILITGESQNRFINITVKDKGWGIDKEHLSKIFNRFYRVDKARSRNEGGTGLGLAIVKHIARYHNGKIQVTSKKNQGSSFIFSIMMDPII